MSQPVTNRMFLGNPDDHCPRCGTNLRANVGQHLRPCPLCTTDDDDPEPRGAA